VPEKFLIIGASSFYGTHFAKYVREHGDEAIEMSLRNWWPRVLEKEQPGYVVNFAAANIVAESWDKPFEYCEVNVCKHTELIEFLRKKTWLKRYIHVSTPEVYGNTPEWVDESCRFNPSTPYAVSRAATDMMLTAYYSVYGFPAIITRTANIYGQGQSKNRIIPLAIDKLRRLEKVHLDGGGESVRCFIHVKDACAATYLIAKAGTAGETYHISTWDQHSIYYIVSSICGLLGLDADEYLLDAPERLGKDHAYLMQSHKLRTLGWKDTITFEQGLEECVSSH